MTIHLPYIDTDNHFATIISLYDAKAADYNATVALERDNGDRTRNILKSAHRELYRELVFSLKARMNSHRYIMRDVPELLKIEALAPLVLPTNRKRLSQFTKKSEATIYRLTERLIDANIILEKINHGTQRDYEVLLNPEMLPVWDHKNVDFDPLTFIMKNTADCALQSALRSICTPCSSNINIYNNKIITENEQEHEKESAAPMLSITSGEHTRTFHGNTGDSGRSVEEAIASAMSEINTSVGKSVTTNAFGMPLEPINRAKINTLDDYGEKLAAYRKREEERVRRYAIMLVEFVISVLFSDRTIYKFEREKAYRHAEYYFKTFNSSLACEGAMESYRERVRIVQRYLESNKEFDFSNIWPAHYLDPENFSSGFVMTSKWLKKHREYQDLQHKTRKLNTDQKMLDYALKRLEREYRNKSAFIYWRSYLINKAPSKIQEYEHAAIAILRDKNNNYYKKAN